MKSYHSNLNPIDANEQQQAELLQKWEMPFRDLLDEIYFPGYSKQLMQDNPEEYNRQYWYFINMYD